MGVYAPLNGSDRRRVDDAILEVIDRITIDDGVEVRSSVLLADEMRQ